MKREIYSHILILAVLLLGSVFPSSAEASSNTSANSKRIETFSLPSEQLEDLVKELRSKVDTKYKQPGWVVSRYNISRSYTSMLPNEVEIPENYVSETWFHINDKKKVDQHVTIMMTEEGEILQYTVNTEGKSWNSISDKVIRLELFDIGDLDNQNLHRLLKYADNNEYTIYYEELNGYPVVRFSVTDDF